MSTCTTVSELIDAFGGVTATAARFSVTPPAVSNWKARDAFPDRLHYRIAKEADAAGIAVDPKLFEQRAA